MTTPLPDLFPRIFDRLRESILVTDTELDEPGPRVVYANPAFTRLTGYSSAELQGRSPRVLQGPASDRELLARLRRHLAAGEAFEGETINYRKDGTPFVMQWYIEPLPDANGDVQHFVAVQRDVTLERERTRQLRRLEQAIGQLVDFALLFKADGRVTYVNRAFLHWCGRGRSDVLGATVWSLPGAPKRGDLAWARRVLGQGAAWRCHYTVERGGRRRVVGVTVSPIVNESGDREFLAIGRDITDQPAVE